MAAKCGILCIRFPNRRRFHPMPQDPVLPPKPRRRRPSSTRLMKSARAAGFSVHGIKVDPVTGEYTVLVGDPAPPAKAPDEDVDLDRELEDWGERRGR